MVVVVAAVCVVSASEAKTIGILSLVIFSQQMYDNKIICANAEEFCPKTWGENPKTYSYTFQKYSYAFDNFSYPYKPIFVFLKIQIARKWCKFAYSKLSLQFIGGKKLKKIVRSTLEFLRDNFFQYRRLQETRIVFSYTHERL